MLGSVVVGGIYGGSYPQGCYSLSEITLVEVQTWCTWVILMEKVIYFV